MGTVFVHCSIFQSKGHGQHGIIGVLAQGHAMPTPGLVQCFIVVTCHAQELQVKQETVKVRHSLSSLFKALSCFSQFSVEGSWTAWGAFGACSTTCGTGSHSQTRSYTGNRPCTSSDTNTQSCIGKFTGLLCHNTTLLKIEQSKMSLPLENCAFNI